MRTLLVSFLVFAAAGCTCGGNTLRVGGMGMDAGSADAGAEWFTVPNDAGTADDAGLAQDAGQVAGELCGNGVDDDGDGEADEDCTCAMFDTRSCFTGDPTRANVGVCHAGVQTCEASGEFGFWGACRDEVLPGVEVCNGLDDDCDGQLDEGLTMSCSSACGAGTSVCTSGAWGACSAPQPSAEVCNGLDDDCNGQIDDGVSRACSTACGSGVELCSAGTWGSCSARAPSTEVCNGLDDDCDGQLDENLTRGCASMCGTGTETCSAGSWGGCTARTPTAEICGNSLDENCDGMDDRCVCIRTSQTPWQMHHGEAPTCWPQQFPTHGDVGEYAYSTIPPLNDPGWQPHAAANISFNAPSTMCGAAGQPDLCTCRAGGDFTYFQTTFEIPSGFTVTSMIVSVADVDDGVRVTIFNANYPGGVVGGHAYLGGGATSDLRQYLVSGTNRIVLTHIDDCCQVRRIANATITLNGTAIGACE